MSVSSGDNVRKPRTIVLCFDGTANQYDGDNTNVVNFFSVLKRDDFEEQICYYQPGVGTYFNPGMVSPIFQWCAKILDEAFAWYLDEHVMQGYRFLMSNYRVGDKICLFGFSRGAYTARALAGMLHKVGLLPKDNDEQIPFAYKLYKRTDVTGLQLCSGFKQTFCQTVSVEFVGVWETVASVGVLWTRVLPFTTSNTTIKRFRHALSLDEHRVKFLPNLYHRPVPNAKDAEEDPEHDSPIVIRTPDTAAESLLPAKKLRGTGKLKRLFSPKSNTPRGGVEGMGLGLGMDKLNGDLTTKGKERASGEKTQGKEEVLAVNGDTTPSMHGGNTNTIGNGHGDITVVGADSNVAQAKSVGGTDVCEVWFSGVHADVGGGAVANSTTLALKDITLRWMVQEVMEAQCGVLFDSASLKRLNIPELGLALRSPALSPSPFSSPSTMPSEQTHLGTDAVHLSVPGSSGDGGSNPTAAETQLDKMDAIQVEHDELGLKGNWAWWFLEILPMRFVRQDALGVWHKSWCIHLGRGREIPEPNPTFHITVKERMEDASLKYTPRAKWTGTPKYYLDA